MTAQPARRRLRAAALALCGLAVIATTACAGAASAASARQQQAAAVTSVPVVVSCGGKTQVRPGEYILACGDGGALAEGLNWAAWGSSSALASGTYALNDCTPDCAAGHFDAFPALVVLWGSQSLPGHAGVRYFTQVTIIYTGNRSYTQDGKRYQLPQTQTDPLSRYGGAGLLSGILVLFRCNWNSAQVTVKTDATRGDLT